LLPRLLDTVDAARARFVHGADAVEVIVADNSSTDDTAKVADADMQIHPESFNAIDRALANPRIIGGATGVTMERWSAGIAFTYALFVPMVWLTRFDTGVVFCRRDDFIAIEGYDETRHFAEDVEFVWKLLRLGWSRRQRLTRLRPVKAIASTRKFDRYGDWHYFTMMPMLLAGTIRARASDAPAARRYWYDDR
jgi:hypothetical protein